MSSTTVHQFAIELKMPTNALLEQLNRAGIHKTNQHDILSDQDKTRLLNHLRALNATTALRKIKLTRKQLGASDNGKTVQVEVRKKRVLVNRNEAGAGISATPSDQKLFIKGVEATAFKAFRNFKLDLDGRNLLVYGGNGAGKSSFYWMLYTFFQSGQKSTDDVSKYFDPEHPKKLVNIHATPDEQSNAGISLHFEGADGTQKTFKISFSEHQTKNAPDITKSNIASDFVTYRVISDFYRFKHSEKINLWPIFESEILPFCHTPGNAQIDLGEQWQSILAEHQALSDAVKTSAKKVAEFEQKIEDFCVELAGAIQSISREAQKFYDSHFSSGDPAKILVAVGLIDRASYDIQSKELEPPKIGFEVKVGDQKVDSPHTFLNEAKLTQLALSVRFGATLTRLREAPLKLLALDDLLISLDMSNRMQVVNIILGESFADYQKIILTHDLGFFREFQRRIGPDHAGWRFIRLTGKASENISAENEKNDLQKAEDYLNGYDLDAAANSLRKAAEDTAKRYRAWADGKEAEPGEFFSLTQDLQAARNKLLEGLPSTLYRKVLRGLNDVTEPHRALILSASDNDLDNNTALTPKDRGILKSKRKDLRLVLSHEGWAKMKTLEAVDSVLAMTARVLNPASHSHTTPLYEIEVREALEKVQQLMVVLGTEMNDET